MTVEHRTRTASWQVVAVMTLVAALVAGCGTSDDDQRARPTITEAPSDPPTQDDEDSATDPAPTSEPAVPEVTEVAGPALPGLLTATTPGIQTGGEYVDPDGFKADVAITLYGPVGLDGDVADTLDLCPDQTEDGSTVAEDLAASGLKTDGAIAWAFEVAVTSPDAQFPFPLDERLAEVTSVGGGDRPSLANTDLQPAYKVSRSCVVDRDASSASWVGFAMIAPQDVSTPNNPDGKLPTVYDEPLGIRLDDPLFDLAGALGSSWSMTPDTEYGPLRGGSGDNGWMFEFDLAPLADRFVSVEESSNPFG